MDSDSLSPSIPHSADESARTRFLASMGFGHVSPTAAEGQEVSLPEDEDTTTGEGTAESPNGLALSSHDEWELPGYPATAEASRDTSDRSVRCQIKRVEFAPSSRFEETGLGGEASPGAEEEQAAECVSDPDLGSGFALDDREGVEDASSPDGATNRPVAPVSADGVDEDPLMQLECPKCHGELVLKREHLGVEGRCVWCGTDIVAASSRAERRVRVFALFKPSPADLPAESEGSPSSLPDIREKDAALLESPAPRALCDIVNAGPAPSNQADPSPSSESIEDLQSVSDVCSETIPEAQAALVAPEPVTSVWGLDRQEEGGGPESAADLGLSPIAPLQSPSQPSGFASSSAQAWGTPPSGGAGAEVPPPPVQDAVGETHPSPMHAPADSAAIPGTEGFGSAFSQAWGATPSVTTDAEEAPSPMHAAPADSAAMPGTEGFGNAFSQAWGDTPSVTTDAEEPPSPMHAAPADSAAMPGTEGFGNAFSQAWGTPPSVTTDAEEPPSPMHAAPADSAAMPGTEGFGNAFSQAWGDTPDSASGADEAPVSERIGTQDGFASGDALGDRSGSHVEAGSPAPVESGFHISTSKEDAFSSPQGWDAFLSGAPAPESEAHQDGLQSAEPVGEKQSGQEADGFQGLFTPSASGSFANSLFTTTPGDEAKLPGDDAVTQPDDADCERGARSTAETSAECPIAPGETVPAISSTSLGSVRRKRRIPSKGFVVLMAVILGVVCGAALASFVLPVGDYVAAGRAFMEGVFPPSEGAAVFRDVAETGAVR